MRMVMQQALQGPSQDLPACQEEIDDTRFRVQGLGFRAIYIYIYIYHNAL